jgi:SAGA-associated factor 29
MKEGARVCAKPPNVKMQPQDWILGTVLRFVPASNKYIVLDEDDSDTDPWARDASTARQHQVPARQVLPLPLTEPSLYTHQNEFQRGTWVLALYPDTTCFYKARARARHRTGVWGGRGRTCGREHGAGLVRLA